jgi:tRNA (adenine37-N6)-methyltransferase
VELVVRPVGFARSPFLEKAEAPRQSTVGVASGAAGSIEILPEFRDALDDLRTFERIWLLFWFHQAEGWRSKVLPPRSDVRRGVFATRSPHRPNPIGMSVVRLERIEGLRLDVLDLDLVDGTPILDLKPYLAYADAFPEAAAGWLERRDPRADWDVVFDAESEPMFAWILAQTGLDLRERARSALVLGPQPHAYRRIRETDDGKRVLALKEWRVRFRVDPAATRIQIERVTSGYRPRDLAEGADPVHAVHRAFEERFGRA